MKINNFKQLHHKKIWVNSMIGMTWGFIATLVVGTIIALLAIEQNNVFSKFIINIKNTLYFICPFAIGVGIGIKNKHTPLQVLAIGITSFIVGQSLIKPKFDVSSIFWNVEKDNFNINDKLGNPGDVFGAFIGSIIMSYIFKMFSWETLLDIILVPLVGVLIGLIGMFSITYLTSTILVLVEWIIYKSANHARWAGILLAPFIGAIMGLALSFPTSSAAIAFSISLKGDAATAAMAGTAAQMITFGVLTYISTKKLSTSFAVGLGTSMLQMKNFTRKPILLLIPTAVSALCALIAVVALPLDFPERGVTSGMGTCGLYGQIFTLNDNGWTNWKAYLNVFLIQLILPFILSFAAGWFILNKHKIIKKEWLVI